MNTSIKIVEKHTYKKLLLLPALAGALFTAFFRLEAMELALSPSKMAPLSPSKSLQKSPEKALSTLLRLFPTPPRPTAYGTNTENNCGMKTAYESMKNTKPGDLIFSSLFVGINKKMLKLLNDKYDEGVLTDINLDQYPGNKKIWSQAARFTKVFNANRKRKKADSTFPQSAHIKFWGWRIGELYHVLFGSQNSSFLAESNKEIMVLDTTKETFDSFYALHKQISALSLPINKIAKASPTKTPEKANYSKNPILEKTPEKPTNIVSVEHNINGTLAQRIKNSNGKLALSIHSINNQEVKEVCQDAAQRGVLKTVIINGTQLKNAETISFLTELEKHGTAVYVFNPTQEERVGRCPIAAHMKVFLREDNGATLIMIGSANPTDENNHDINHTMLYPNNPELVEDVRTILQDTITASHKLSDALALIKVHQAKKRARNEQKESKQEKEEEETTEEQLPPAKKKTFASTKKLF